MEVQGFILQTSSIFILWSKEIDCVIRWLAAARSQCRNALFIPFTSQLQLLSCTVPMWGHLARILCCINNCVLQFWISLAASSSQRRCEMSEANNFYFMTTGTSFTAQNQCPLDTTPGALSLCLRTGMFLERSEVWLKVQVFSSHTKEWQWWSVLCKSEIIPLCAFQINLVITILHHV